jgi:hypothetical protein
MDERGHETTSEDREAATLERQAEDWLELEARGSRARRELQRLVRRARARWRLTLLVALALTGGVVWRAIRKPPRYQARVLLRITEGTVAQGELVPPSELRDHLASVAFSKGRLLALIEKHDLYESLMDRDPELAVAAMRDDIDIGVSNNYFLEYRREDAPPRSVRIVLDYSAHDAGLAFTVVQDLGRTLIEAETETRRQVSQVAADTSRRASDNVRNLLYAVEEQLAIKALALRRGEGDAALLRVEIAKLQAETRALESQLSGLEADERELTLRRSVEANDLGLRFEVVNAIRPADIRPSLKRALILAAIVFVVCFPVCAIAVGAFDSRVRDVGDVRRLGIEVVGHVPSFPGSETASLRARLRGERPPHGKPPGAVG